MLQADHQLTIDATVGMSVPVDYYHDLNIQSAASHPDLIIVLDHLVIRLRAGTFQNDWREQEVMGRKHMSGIFFNSVKSSR